MILFGCAGIILSAVLAGFIFFPKKKNWETIILLGVPTIIFWFIYIPDFLKNLLKYK